jgi:hypothetical protein
MNESAKESSNDGGSPGAQNQTSTEDLSNRLVTVCRQRGCSDALTGQFGWVKTTRNAPDPGPISGK